MQAVQIREVIKKIQPLKKRLLNFEIAIMNFLKNQNVLPQIQNQITQLFKQNFNSFLWFSYGNNFFYDNNQIKNNKTVK